MILDGCSALVYLLSGRKAEFRAVVAAHKEYKASRKLARTDARTRGSAFVAVASQPPATIRGMYKGSILIRALLHRQGPVPITD